MPKCNNSDYIHVCADAVPSLCVNVECYGAFLGLLLGVCSKCCWVTVVSA